MIHLQDSVNWEVGQYVLITTSIYKDLIEDQNEMRQITAVNGKSAPIAPIYKIK